ncbi:MAG TPA: hypothetical protein VKZ53_24255 [Candidatus Angelobacter sp.]|nr:hypothetical protein [Candidatus Angelobacter sp.]
MNEIRTKRDTIKLQEPYKDATIYLTITAWSDGKFSLVAHYMLGDSKIGGFNAQTSREWTYSPSVDAVKETGLTWAKREIDRWEAA